MSNIEVLTPDGFTIEYDKSYYPSMKEAKKAFNEWKQRYERQGYYSSNDYGRIPLNELINYMSFNEV